MISGIATTTISAVFLGIAFIFVILRCLSRFLIRSFGIDDVLVVLAFLSALSLTVIIFEQKAVGLGRGLDQLSEEDISHLLLLNWTGIMCFCLGLTLAKNSAILQCLRFILIGKRRIFCWCLIAFITMFGFASILVNILQCSPVASYWKPSDPGKCVDLAFFWEIASVLVIVTDILAVLVPILTVRGMQLPRRQKFMLIFIFSLGALACLCPFLRIIEGIGFVKSEEAKVVKTDFALILWSTLELNLGIICVCAPPLKAIVVKIAPSWLTEAMTRDRNRSNSLTDISGETLATNNGQPLPSKWSDIDLVLADEGHILSN